MPIEISSDSSNKGYFNQQVPSISRDEYLTGIDNFNFCFTYDDVGNKGTAILIPWQSFAQKVELEIQAIPNLHEDQAVVAFYHGYDTHNNKVRVGFRVFEINTRANADGEYHIMYPNRETRSFPSHEFLQEGDMVRFRGSNILANSISNELSSWPFSQNYFNPLMKVHRSPRRPVTMSFNPVSEQEDPKMVIFPWINEISKMADDNTVPASHEKYLIISDFTPFIEDGATRVKIAGDDGYYHSKSLHIGSKDPNGVIDELNKAGCSVCFPNFTNLGLDYGNLCPPRCGEVKF